MLFTKNKVEIKFTEVKRLLGNEKKVYPENITALIKESIQATENLIKPRAYLKILPLRIKQNFELILADKLSINSSSLYELLKDCSQVAVFAITIGSEVETLISQSFQQGQHTKATIIDAAASVAVEELAENLAELVTNLAQRKNLCPTRRYSPGYGDLSLELQAEIINFLQQNKKIFKVNSSHLLSPRKSATGFIGLGKTEQNLTQKSCHHCQLNKCNYRKEL